MRALSVFAVALALLAPATAATDSPLPAPKKFTLMPSHTNSDAVLGSQTLLVRRTTESRHG
jgi:hypothetical protein